MSQVNAQAAAVELADAFGRLVRRIRAAGAATDGLSFTDHAVLARLDREGPATTADLARAHGVKPQSMGATVGALVAAGLLRRVRHPTDGRQVNLVLTAAGAAILKSRRSAKRAWLAEAFERLDRDEQRTLLASTQIIRKLVES